MNPVRKNMILAIVDGDHRCLPLIHQLEHSPKRMMIYKWFIVNKITGKKFIDFWNEKNGNVLSVLKYVLSKVEKQKKFEIIGGVDF